jgi:excisionase family DNA binding protein
MNVPGLRSPHAEVGGMVYFGRMLDKIRLHEAGKLPADYQKRLGGGFDGRCVRFLRVDYGALVERVKQGGSDEEILQWCFASGQKPDEEAIKMWNTFMRNIGSNDKITQLIERRKKKGKIKHLADMTIFDYIDLDEKRSYLDEKRVDRDEGRANRDEERDGRNLLTVNQTAEYLRIPLPTVYYLVQHGQLPAIQIGGRWRIKKDALDRVVRGEQRDPPTVLVVDDDENVQETFKLCLRNVGFSRMIVGTGKEALAALKKQRFDLCFLDLMLPDIRGDAIYKDVKASQANLPVVIVTDYLGGTMLDKILKFGPVTVLQKPLNVEQLTQTLKFLGFKL